MVLLLIRQNAVMMLYMAVGYLLFKRGLLTRQGSGELGKLLLYVVMPMAILKSYLRDYSPELMRAFAVSFAAALAALALSFAVSALFFRGRKAVVRRFSASFSNAGFIGIPLVQMTLGEEAVFYVASFVTLLNILQWTYGLLIMTGDRSMISGEKILKNPIVITFAVGLPLFLLPVRLPELVTGVVGTLAAMNGPLAMLVLGAYLAQLPLKSVFTDPQSYFCSAVRLVLIPLLTIPLLSLVPGKDMALRVALLLVAAAPVGSNVAIFVQLYGEDYSAAVKDVCLSTLLSVGTLPLLMALSNLIWGA